MDLLYRFVGIDPANLKGPGHWNIRLGEGTPRWVILLYVAFVAWYTYWLYAKPKGTASPRFRVLLGLLRGALFLLLFIILLKPALVIEKSQLKQSTVALLVDTSLSMSLKDEYEGSAASALARNLNMTDPEVGQMSRLELVKRMLLHPDYQIPARLAKACTLKTFEFSDGVKEVTDLAPLKEAGYSTRLGDAIAEVAGRLKGRSLAAMIVVSDGRSNAGKLPIEAARDVCLASEPPITVFAVGVGSTYQPPDAAVGELFASEVAALGDIVNFNVTLSATGLQNQTLSIELYQEAKLVASRPLTIRSATEHQNVTLSFKPSEPGTFTYTIKVPPVPGERITENNAATHTMRIVERKVKVLLLSDYPSWEFRFLKNALLRDRSVTASCLLQSADPGYMEGEVLRRYPSTLKELFAFDCVIWQDVNPQALAETDIENTVRFVQDSGGGFLLQAGPVHTPGVFKDTPLEQILPVSLPEPEIAATVLNVPLWKEPFKPRLTDTALSHPITNLGDENARLWDELPAQLWFYPAKRVKPGAQALLLHPFETNEYGNYPLAAVQFYGSGRVMFLGIDSTWLWRYWQGDKQFYRFWGQAIRYLSTGRILGSNKRVSLTTNKSTYIVGEQVRVKARWLDENYRPASEGAVEVRIESLGKSKTLKLTAASGQPGMYETVFPAGAPGSYTLKLSVGPEEATRVFQVTMPQLEFAATQLDEAGLESLARMTGGKYLRLSDAARVPELVKSLEQEITTEIRDDLWDSPLAIVIVVLLLSAEWILRKWRLLM